MAKIIKMANLKIFELRSEKYHRIFENPRPGIHGPPWSEIFKILLFRVRCEISKFCLVVDRTGWLWAILMGWLCGHPRFWSVDPGPRYCTKHFYIIVVLMVPVVDRIIDRTAITGLIDHRNALWMNFKSR